MPPTMFSEAEIERMRLMVIEHDKGASMNQFDLNNPPRKNYTHQEFPKAVYSLDSHEKPLVKRVLDEAEYSAALKAGWTDEPQAIAEPEEIVLDAAAQAEVDSLEKRLAEVRKQKAGSRARRASR